MVKRTSSERRESQDLDAERSVLGACLLHAEAVPEVAAILNASDFYLSRHAIIFRALLAAHADKGLSDPILVGDELKRHGRLEEAGGHEQLLDLMEGVVTAVGVDRHAEIVREHARRRRLVDIAVNMQTRATDGEDSVELAAMVEQQLREVASSGATSGALTPRDVIAQWAKDGPLVHVPTGFVRFDEMTGGGPPFGSRCYVLGAPDAGKTAAIVQIADTLLGRGIACGFLAIDEEPGDILGRFLQRRGFTRRECEQREPHVLDAMGKLLANEPLRLYSDEFDIEEAARDLAAFASKQGRRAAYFVDSVQTARSAHEGKESSLHVAVTARVRAIRAVTTAYGFVTYTTSEMGRAAYRSLDAGERVSDLAAAKESGAIEYSARFMVVLRSVPNESNLVEARIAKNKFGPRTREDEPGVHLRLDRERQVITEDAAHVVQGDGDRDEQRALKRIQQAVEDAAVLALVIVDEPGIAKTDAEDMLLSRARCGTRRWKSAFSTLRHAIVEQPAPRNRLSLYLDGAKVSDEVMAEVPIDQRPRVLASVPNRELHRAAPSCTGDPGAPHAELHHHPLRSRGGAARRCSSSGGSVPPGGAGAAQEEGGAP